MLKISYFWSTLNFWAHPSTVHLGYHLFSFLNKEFGFYLLPLFPVYFLFNKPIRTLSNSFPSGFLMTYISRCSGWSVQKCSQGPKLASSLYILHIPQCFMTTSAPKNTELPKDFESSTEHCTDQSNFLPNMGSQKVHRTSQVLVTHTCSPSYSGGKDVEDHSSTSALANSSRDPILKKSCYRRGWWSGSNVEHLPGKYETLSWNPGMERIKKLKKKKKKNLFKLLKFRQLNTEDIIIIIRVIYVKSAFKKIHSA
jgi:hypothetical protein